MAGDFEEAVVYRGISVSPLHGSFAPGYEPKPSDLENLIAGRERKLTDLVDQSEFQSLLGGQVDILGPSRSEKIGGHSGALSQNGLGSRFIFQGGIKGGL